MRTRHSALVAIAALPLLALLTACGPGGSSPSPTPSDSPTPSESPTPDAEPLDLPDDAVLAITAVATAGNGATADVLVVVHAPVTQGTPGASEAATAIVDWCEGEVDDSVLAAQNYSFVTVDVSVTATAGAWPTDAQLVVLPVQNPDLSTILAVSPSLHQVEIVDDSDPGAYVPHCLQPAFLDGAGSGSLYLGFPTDITGWTRNNFGLSAVLPDPLGTTAVTFSDCVSVVPDLAGDFGAPSAAWAEHFDATACSVGGAG